MERIRKLKSTQAVASIISSMSNQKVNSIRSKYKDIFQGRVKTNLCGMG